VETVSINLVLCPVASGGAGCLSRFGPHPGRDECASRACANGRPQATGGPPGATSPEIASPSLAPLPRRATGRRHGLEVHGVAANAPPWDDFLGSGASSAPLRRA